MKVSARNVSGGIHPKTKASFSTSKRSGNHRASATVSAVWASMKGRFCERSGPLSRSESLTELRRFRLAVVFQTGIGAEVGPLSAALPVFEQVKSLGHHHEPGIAAGIGKRRAKKEVGTVGLFFTR